MARLLTCPVCGYRPIQAPFTEREELELLGEADITRGVDEPKSAADAFAAVSPDVDAPAWVWVECPNKGGAHGPHRFRFNRQTGEVAP